MDRPTFDVPEFDGDERQLFHLGQTALLIPSGTRNVVTGASVNHGSAFGIDVFGGAFDHHFLAVGLFGVCILIHFWLATAPVRSDFNVVIDCDG